MVQNNYMLVVSGSNVGGSEQMYGDDTEMTPKRNPYNEELTKRQKRKKCKSR